MKAAGDLALNPNLRTKIQQHQRDLKRRIDRATPVVLADQKVHMEQSLARDRAVARAGPGQVAPAIPAVLVVMMTDGYCRMVAFRRFPSLM
jgi:hypothetical protein